ncbi:transposase family protein : Uncharacterized protein OS=Singulisphaera acidiphila (strain ATCC BAA-1392 / DSM 18658 / VKM B-2454 / MOB10) GN=Sinac_2157 PE=4 SV=1 [Gemmata massiliana]|uniref:Transposase family protein: Uncharacterized protein n=1 Tax=Gemmata massiliana TaxID=1210884 RepID=A0A6P2D036_9BACT|nr:transposase family protein : Uncharacterized protein OS=Singulisphaera acidiphila (strain ATCC BAA-1392 / DSM 18658 / VKM B-2454 / MOB10) GN=Sinac_2157 PE=4 SV=1 [Gemmata massiliana]
MDPGGRAVTSWIRAGGLSDAFRPCDTTVSGAGKRTDLIAAHRAHGVVKPLVTGATRLVFALDDAPTERYGPHVQGAGAHHNPCPGPANGPFVYGHVWVVLGLLAAHPTWGAIALPLLARLYVRQKNLVVGAGQQQVRFVWANVGSFHLCLWAFTMTEAWAWCRGEKALVGHRLASPWDDEPRRPSHADKRRAWRRELPGDEIRAALHPGASEREIRAAAERLLNLAA